MTTQTQNDDFHQKHKGVSPILATVILLAVTVVGGGVTFALLSSGTQTASSQNVIAIENAQAVKGTDHADITATIKNAGSKPWSKIEMTVAKSELSEPLLYESLHENAQGCSGSISTSDGSCSAGPAKGRDNPLRMQWLATLDKTSGTDGLADFGEGISVGRKFVFENKDSYRSILVLNNTAIAAAFNGTNGQLGAGITTCNVPTGSWTNCGDLFDDLDTSTDGQIACRNPDLNDETIVAECKVFTHVNMDKNISPGESRYFYADAFTKSVTGLNNVFVQVGDALVVNLVAEDVDGGTARAQTIIKVTGV